MGRFSTPSFTCYQYHLIVNDVVENFLFLLINGQVENIGAKSRLLKSQAITDIIYVPRRLPLSLRYHRLMHIFLYLLLLHFTFDLFALYYHNFVFYCWLVRMGRFLTLLLQVLLFLFLSQLIGVDAVELFLLEGHLEIRVGLSTA